MAPGVLAGAGITPASVTHLSSALGAAAGPAPAIVSGRPRPAGVRSLSSDGGPRLPRLWGREIYPYRPRPTASPWTSFLPLWIPEPARAGRYELTVSLYDDSGAMIEQRQRVFTLPSVAQLNR